MHALQCFQDEANGRFPAAYKDVFLDGGALISSTNHATSGKKIGAKNKWDSTRNKMGGGGWGVPAPVAPLPIPMPLPSILHAIHAASEGYHVVQGRSQGGSLGSEEPPQTKKGPPECTKMSTRMNKKVHYLINDAEHYTDTDRGFEQY